MTIDDNFDNYNTPENAFQRNPHIVVESKNIESVEPLVPLVEKAISIIPILNRFSEDVLQDPDQNCAFDPLTGLLFEDSPVHKFPLIQELVGMSSCLATFCILKQEMMEGIFPKPVSIEEAKRLAEVPFNENTEEGMILIQLQKYLGKFIKPVNSKTDPGVYKNTSSDDLITINTVEDALGYFQSRITELSAEFPLNDTEETLVNNPSRIEVKNPEELDSLMAAIIDINHDLKNPYQLIYGPLSSVAANEEQGKILTDILLSGITEFYQATQNSVDKVIQRFPHDVLAGRQMLKLFNIWGSDLQRQGIKLIVDEESFRLEGKVTGSKNWIAALLKNIGINGFKAFNERDNRLIEQEPDIEDFPPREIRAKSRIIEIDGQLYRDYIIQDRNQLGYPGRLVVGGFTRGGSYWTTQDGTGIGMHNHRGVIKNQYNGDLLARVERDPNTGEIIGSETILRLPITE